ncbi:MAG: hypothetical protein KC535_00265 [Nanoarchaeota archaeon]|nr:hypothetical protein [Nanoarchaeota archaeon]
MDERTLEKISHQIVFILTGIWGIFLIPIVIMIIFLTQEVSTLPTDNILVANILYYNLLTYPFVLTISSAASWFSLKNKKYRMAIILSLIPFLNILLEFIAADIALFFS